MAPTSPYKKFKNTNSSYVVYTSVKNLTAHKLYKVMNIEDTNHDQYGKGYMLVLKDSNKKQFKTQMPNKYLAQLTIPDDINSFRSDIAKNKNPYFIFREVLGNNSFRVDMIEGDTNANTYYDTNVDYPELAESDEEN